MNKNLLEFLSTENVVEIRDEMEFAKFKTILDKYGLLWIFSSRNDDTASIQSLKSQKVFNYNYWRDLQKINAKTSKDTDLLLEYDVNKGIAFYMNREIAADWYGKEPFTVENLE